MNKSTTHLVLIPSYNTGAVLLPTVDEALQNWQPVWVVIDGSTDGSEQPLLRRAAQQSDLRVLIAPHNEGKGAAVARGAQAAHEAGFTHALVMDADGQHPAREIPRFMEASQRDPHAMILGRPQFGDDAPRVRLWGRQLSVGLAWLEGLGPGVRDPLFGFRVYPLASLLAVFRETAGARHFDFDHEVALRLFWAGTRPRNLAAACRYLPRGGGGVSHFHYFRDNVRLVAMHFRLMLALLPRVPRILRHRRAWAGDYGEPAP